jgi:hypothetical protein
MAATSSSETISWREAVEFLINGGGIAEVGKRLLDAILSGKIEYWPAVATPLDAAYYNGLFDPETGVLRMGPGDNKPRVLRLVRSDFERQFKHRTVDRGVVTDGYMPGYLDLLHRAIKHFSISDDNQPKADELTAWFQQQSVNGERVSKNLARAMTTIVRRPDRKKGGAIAGRRSKG